ncbi:MAG: 2-succinylbenzoyl-CoA synthetase [Deltaproteobacteria bacterium]|nr:2-succinylbenzoyl-CoA synthetase [Deltaproteobacteria bacterium]
MTVNIGSILTRRARRDPELESLVDVAAGLRLTYSELDDRSNRLANALLDSGAKKGDRVGLLLMNGVEFVECFFGAAKGGFVNVPLNWRLVADELEFILSDSGVSVLVFSHDFAEIVSDLRARGTTSVEQWIQVGGAPADGCLAYESFRTSASPDPCVTEVDGDDLVFIMYTSGTTGLPKGVMHSHDTVMWMIFTMISTSDMHRQDRYLNSMPLFHVGALAPALGSVHMGGALVIMRAFDPVQSWELIEAEKITSTLMVPAMLQFMLGVLDKAKHDFSSLRWIMSGAAPVPVTLIQAYLDLGVEIQQVYGLTETCGPACLITGADAVRKAGSTGHAFFFTEAKVVNAQGHEVAPGEAGEVLVAGPHVMVGYWNRPEATAETIVDGWLHTGDVATVDEGGFITIVDRVKDMLISGGENVYPAEIENVLLGHPGVSDAGVIGIPSKKWGESPLAVLVRSDSELTAQDVMDHCKGKLAPFKVVKAVEFVDEIPRNPSGKILKRELRELFSYDASE